MIRWTPSWGELASLLVTGPVGRPAALRRFSAPAKAPGFWVALWALVAAVEFVALIPVLFGSDPVAGSDVDLQPQHDWAAWRDVSRLLGGSFAACGVIAWRRRPDSRSGPLMIVTGAGFLLNPLLSEVQVPAVQTLGFLATDLGTLAFVPLLLTILTAGR